MSIATTAPAVEITFRDVDDTTPYPEDRLYEKLAAQHGNAAHSRYNALIRRLVSFEHAATGAAQIVPRHSACAELWADAAEIVEPVDTYVPAFSPLEMQAVAPEGVAAALERLYADRAYRTAMSLAAYRNGTS